MSPGVPLAALLALSAGGSDGGAAASHAREKPGSLSKEIIGKIIRRHWREVRDCYEREYDKDPTLSGGVRISFTIGAGGGVSEAHVQKTTLHNATVESCLVSHVLNWRFPEPAGSGAVHVTYPWDFRPVP